MNGMSHISHQGVPCGTNRLKKCSLCFQKPTTSTVPKLRIARTAVTVRWLVTVKAWTPGTMPKGIMPMKFATRMNMNSEKTSGTYFLPSGPTLVETISLMKPFTPSTAACQRPGTIWRFMPPSMNTQIVAMTKIMNSEELVNEMS